MMAGLSPGYELEGNLTCEASSQKWDKLKELFKELTLCVQDSLLHQSIQPYQLSSYLSECSEDELLLENYDQRLNPNIVMEFNEKESFDKFWCKMENSICFFSYELLKAVINSKYIDESIQQKLINYEKEFRKMSLDITKHYVGEENMRKYLPSEGTTRLVVKTVEKFTTYSDVHVRKFKITLASAIDVTPDHLHLTYLSTNCTILTYRAPLYIEVTAFPLSQEQEKILTELGVVWLNCGKYKFLSQGEVLNPSDSPASDNPQENNCQTLSVGHKPDVGAPQGNTGHVTSKPQNLDITKHMDAVEKENSELTKSELLPELKISDSTKSMSTCILHDIVVCCEYMSSITQIKVIEDKSLTNFTSAAKIGDLEQVNEIFKSRNVAKRELEDAIRLATQAGHLNVVKFLAEECLVNLACESASGIAPLHIAAFNGHETLLEYILNQGIKPSLYSTSRITPFHCACISSNLSTVNALIEHASATFKISNLNVGAETGRSLLHCAVWAQSIILVQYLIDDLGACYNVTCSDEGLPPLFLAIVTGNLELVSYFTSLENIDINETIQRSGSISDITERIAPVHMAAFCGHEKILQHLISERKCNATCRLYDNGATALHLAIGNGHLNCVKFLLELDNDFQSIYKTISPAIFWEERRSFNMHLRDGQQNDPSDSLFLLNTSLKQTSTPTMSQLSSLHLQGNQHFAIFSLFTEKGYELSSKNDEDLNSPLHYAARYGDLETIRYIILELGINPNQLNKYGVLPVHLACINGHMDIVDFFFNLEKCTNHQPDKNKWTVLHYAAFGGHLAIVTYLVTEQHCDMYCKDINGFTPAMMAVHQGHLPVLKFFVKEKSLAIKSCRTNNGKLAIHCACQKGYLDIVKYLIEECDCDRMGRDNGDSNPLHYAAANGHDDIIRYLSENGCNNNCRNKQGNAPLHLAASQGHLMTVKLLIDELGCEKDQHQESGITPLHYAAASNQLSVIKYLTVEKNCSIILCRESSQGSTPVHLAVYKGNLDVIKFFCTELNYDVCNDRNSLGRLPIHIACLHGHIEIVKYLVEDCKCDIVSKDNDSATPIHCAASRGHIELTKYLYNKGCDALCKNKQGLTPVHLAACFGHIKIIKYLSLKLKCYPVIKDDSGYTPAHLAVIYGHLNILKFFANNQSYDVNRDTNDLGHCPIHSACIKGHIEIVKYLIEECGSEKLCRDVRDGYTLLHCAAINGHNHLIRYLHSQGCDIEDRNKKRETPLHVAASHGQLNTVKLLIVDLQCDRESKAVNERTPLHFAASEGHISVVQYLARDSNCDVMCRDTFGHTPAQLAILKGHLNVLKFFVQHFAYDVIGITNNFGQFAIHTACLAGQINIAKYLFEGCHCDITCEDKDGNTPLHLAVSASKNTELMKYLVSEGSNRNAKRHHGVTPLHLAVAEGHLPIVECLTIELKCDIMQKDADGTTPAHVSVILGHIAILKFFVEGCMYEVKSDSNNNGEALIHSASFHGHTSIVKYLIEELECDPMSRDRKGNTPLHFAAVSGHNDVLIYLHELGCEMMCRNTLQETPVHLAVDSGHLETLQSLITNLGCDIKAKTSTDQTPLHYAAAKGHLAIVEYLTTEFECDMLCKSKAGHSPPYLAVSNGHLEVLKYFVNNFNYNVNADKNYAYFLPLRDACFRGYTDIVTFIVEECPFSEITLSDASQVLKAAVINGSQEIIACLHSNGFDRIITNETGDSILHIAALLGKLDTVQFLISELKFNENVMNKHNETPLHCAATKGHLSVIQYLTTKLNCDILCKDYLGDTPAHCAVRNGHLEIVKFCVQKLSYNAHIDRNNEGCLPIHSASLYGHQATLKYLIDELDCNVTSKGNKGNSSMHYAAASGQNAVISFLHKRGSKVECCNNNGATPLHVAAALSGKVQTVRYLISELKCNKKVPDFHNQTPLHYAANSGHLSVVKYLTTELNCDILCRDSEGNTPAHCAVSNGHLKVVKFCVQTLNYNAHIDRNNQGSLPIHSACLYGHHSTLRYLIEELKCDLMSKNDNGTTPIHYAAASGQNAIILYLHQKGCNVECCDKYRNTPLHLAAQYGNVETAKLFICTLNCEKDIKNSNQHTPLHQAASRGHLSVVKLLTAELHCDILSKDCDGDTPLQCAVETGKMDIVKYFVEELNYNIHSVCNNLHQFALHYAALKGHLPIVKYLISQGVDPICMDVFGNQPLHYAAAIGHYEIVQNLVSNGSSISARGIMGKTAADIARVNGHRNIQNLLNYLHLSVD